MTFLHESHPHSGDRHCIGIARDLSAAKLADKALHALITAGEAGLRNQVLSDSLGVAPSGKSEFDQFPKRFTGTGSRSAAGNRGPGGWLGWLRADGHRAG